MDFSKLKKYGIFGITVLFLLSTIILIYGVKSEMDNENARNLNVIKTSVSGYLIEDNRISHIMFN